MQAFLRRIDSKIGGILAHQRKQHTVHRNSRRNSGEHRHGIMAEARQNQMPHQNAAPQNTVFHAILPGLPEHLPQRLGRGIRIVRRPGKCGRDLGIAIFEIRHIDVHQSIQTLQHLHGLIPAAVPYDGNGQTHPYHLQRLAHLVRVWGGRNQINTCGALAL
ncbi:unknown [Clostridium sp. CAG:448]|nr:unknown [Clostridium sp. CAG:448]